MANDGVHPDEVAKFFGYGSGDAMVERLIQYNAPKLAAKMSAKDFVSRVTDIETDRQMQIRHGVLEEQHHGCGEGAGHWGRPPKTECMRRPYSMPPRPDKFQQLGRTSLGR